MANNNEEGASTQESRMVIAETSLHRAVRQDDVDTVRSLIELGKADIEATDNDGKTALHRAVEDGTIELAKLLVTDFGAKVNAKDNDGRTPLHSRSARTGTSRS